jgi:hypothetical protein
MFSKMINLNITEEFRINEKQAKIFGFILYSDSHSNIKKVLRDDDHWSSFNEDSNGWIIFSIKPREGQLKYPNFPEGTIGMMIPVWKEPSENKKILEFFGLQDTRVLPCFVAFTIKENKELSRVSYKLDDDSYDNARNSIKKIINEITATVDNILPEYKDTDSVYREVTKTIERIKTEEKLKDGINKINFLKGLLG